MPLRIGVMRWRHVVAGVPVMIWLLKQGRIGPLSTMLVSKSSVQGGLSGAATLTVLVAETSLWPLFVHVTMTRNIVVCARAAVV